MINGTKINLIYHLYCKNVEDMNNNVFYEINRRCLEHFHEIFDYSVFCVCVDDMNDSELIQNAIKWIWSCGFRENVIIKIKPNSSYRDAQTFYDEIVYHLTEFDGIVFFGHNKGTTMQATEGLKQWVTFLYYSCLDKIEEKVKELCNITLLYSYIPINTSEYNTYRVFKWFLPGTFYLFNPNKLVTFLKKTDKPIPKLTDRFSAEIFFSQIIDIFNEETCDFFVNVKFENLYNTYFDSYQEINFYNINHIDLISYFLLPERVKQYEDFYKKITDGI